MVLILTNFIISIFSLSSSEHNLLGKFLFRSVVLMLIAMIALREGFGDFKEYEYYYYNSVPSGRFEPAWVALSNLHILLGLNFRAYTLTCAILTVLMKVYYIRKLSLAPSVSIILLINLVLWVDLEQIRNGLAFAIFVFGITLQLIKNKILVSWICLIASTLTHYFMIPVVMAYLASRAIKPSKRNRAFLVFSIVASHFFSLTAFIHLAAFIPGFDRLLRYQINSSLSFNHLSMTKIVYTTLAVALVLSLKRVVNQSQTMKLIIFFALMTIFGNLFSEIGVVYIRTYGLVLNGILVVVLVNIAMKLPSREIGVISVALLSILMNFILFRDMLYKFEYLF